MPYFCLKLIPPRPTFLRNMNDAERKLMQEHGAYWHQALEQGKIIAFGPVADPAGAFGVGLAEMKDSAEVQTFADNDPVMKSGIGFRFEFLPMPALVK